MKGRRRLEGKLFPLEEIRRLFNFQYSGSQEGDEEENEAKTQRPGGQVGDNYIHRCRLFLLDFLSKTSFLHNSSIHTFIFFQDFHPTQAREDEEKEAEPPRSHGRKPK